MKSGPGMKFLPAICLAVLGVAALGLNHGNAAAPPPPLSLSGPEWRPLSQRTDKGLQARLERALRQRQAWRTLLDEGKLAVGLVDLADAKTPRLAQVNGETMMYAASLPKIVILLTAFRGFADGALKETPEIHQDLVEMIRRSDNAATNRIIGRLSLRRIAAVVRRYRFYELRRSGGLWVGSAYGREVEQDPEPLKDLLHAATVHQVCRFYYLLAYGRLISPERDRQLLKILAFPDLNDKFVAGLNKAVPLPRLYRKSGEWKIWHSDSILVWGEDWRRYILVAMVEDKHGEQVLKDLVPAVEGLLRPNLPRPSGRTK